MRHLLYQVCYNVSFYFWLIGSVLKHCKVPKYYDQDFSGLLSSLGIKTPLAQSTVVVPLY